MYNFTSSYVKYERHGDVVRARLIRLEPDHNNRLRPVRSTLIPLPVERHNDWAEYDDKGMRGRYIWPFITPKSDWPKDVPFLALDDAAHKSANVDYYDGCSGHPVACDNPWVAEMFGVREGEGEGNEVASTNAE